MKIADTAQARKVVQPVKPQPSKQARGVSDFPSANSPTPILPTTAEKTPKTVVPPKSSTPTTDSSSPMTFDQFLASMGLTTPEQPSQDEINAMITQALQPILDVYNTQLGQLNQQTQTEKSFDQTSAEQLGNFLSALGDPNYTPTMAALLAQNAQRTSAYNAYQSQQDLWNSLIGGQGGALSQIPDIRQQIESQYAGPSSSDLLSAFNAYNSYNNDLFNQGLAGQKEAFNENLATAKQKQAQAAIDATLAKLGISQQSLNLKAQGQVQASKQIDAAASKVAGVLVNKAGKAILGANGKPIPVSGSGRTGGTGVVSPSLSAQVGVAVDGHGNPVFVNGRTVPWTTSTSSKKGKTLSAASVGTFLRSLKKTVSAGTTSRLNADGSRTSTPKTKTVYRMTFPQALKYLRSNGVSDKQARSYLDAIYARGQGGRAWLTNEEQAVLRAVARKQAGPADAHLTRVFKNPKTGRAFLSQLQYQVLKANRMLPSGKWGTDGAGQRVWYIA